MNENRSVFSIHGVTGMLIATVLLLSILVVLTIWGLGVQQSNAANYYEIKDESSIKMFSTENAKHIVDVK
jgi:succinate dehydrogenase/fumarate reductase cytochrome b subunit